MRNTNSLYDDDGSAGGDVVVVVVVDLQMSSTLLSNHQSTIGKGKGESMMLE